ncbi:hypothetical protein ATI61_101712 [Archangium gephyra]|uniref:Uncharacterized protein n=1 Tax=Archangium gephyra TaxID=48 RepID=A0AAC8QB64_9BACT|nr:hypothetical protein [Archangium gephyra]AKJ04194.1 Hypothetical protein AA314_05820 [Archangium gephyra]REG37725.1 hypothetical protein ATI61_101712 [Archangium gephyra]
MISLLLTLSLLNAAPAELKPAFIVIADGAKTQAAADAKLKSYKAKHLPEHGDFPKVMGSSTIKGLNPGFFIVVAAISADEEVANTLAAFIRKKLQGAYVRRVEVEAPEALRLLAIERVKVHMDYGLEPDPISYTLHQEDSMRYSIRGRSHLSPDNGLVLPFTVDSSLPQQFRISENLKDEMSMYCETDNPAKLKQGFGPGDVLVLRVPELNVHCRIAGD